MEGYWFWQTYLIC